MSLTIRRLFGLKDDEVSGGSTYDVLAPSGEVPAPIPDANYFWPATGGTFDKGLEQIDRAAEVRGRRSISPRLPFRAAGVATVPVAAYRSVLEKALRKTLGGTDTVTGSGGAAQTHSLAVLGFAEGPLPAVHMQLVRDNYNLKASGCKFNRLTATFSLDGEGHIENELHSLYFSNYETTPPSASFTGLSSDPLILRDGRVVLDGTGSVIAAPGTVTPTPEAGGGTLTAAAYKYKVTSVNATGSGESLPSPEATVTAEASGKVKLAWVAVAGAGSYNVYRTAAAGGTGTEHFVANTATNSYTDTGTATTSKVLPTEDTSQGIQIPDLTGFEFSFTNNLMKKWYAKRNVVTNIIGNPPLTKKLWHPTEMKLNAAQDVSYRLNFGNVETAQEVAQEFGQIQKLIFECAGPPLEGVTPAATELVRFTIYNAVHNPGAGSGALSARDDIVTELDGTGFYSAADGTDIKVEVINASATPLT